jgi:hypothetical protein
MTCYHVPDSGDFLRVCAMSLLSDHGDYARSRRWRRFPHGDGGDSLTAMAAIPSRRWRRFSHGDGGDSGVFLRASVVSLLSDHGDHAITAMAAIFSRRFRRFSPCLRGEICFPITAITRDHGDDGDFLTAIPAMAGWHPS